MRLGKPSREFRIITNVVLTKLIMDILPWVLIGLINIFGLFQFHFNGLGSIPATPRNVRNRDNFSK